MAKPPRPLIRQIEFMEEVIKNLNTLVDTDKIKVEYYGKDFMDPLNKIRQKALDLRGELEVFKNDMESALTLQYGGGNNRFASDSAQKVIDLYLKRDTCQ